MSNKRIPSLVEMRGCLEPDRVTNYDKLFGTPEKTAETLSLICYGFEGECICDECPMNDGAGICLMCGDAAAYLRKEADHGDRG